MLGDRDSHHGTPDSTRKFMEIHFPRVMCRVTGTYAMGGSIRYRKVVRHAEEPSRRNFYKSTKNVSEGTGVSKFLAQDRGVIAVPMRN